MSNGGRCICGLGTWILDVESGIVIVTLDDQQCEKKKKKKEQRVCLCLLEICLCSELSPLDLKCTVIGGVLACRWHLLEPNPMETTRNLERQRHKMICRGLSGIVGVRTTRASPCSKTGDDECKAGTRERLRSTRCRTASWRPRTTFGMLHCLLRCARGSPGHLQGLTFMLLSEEETLASGRSQVLSHRLICIG